MSTSTKYLLFGRAFITWALVVIALVTCPVKKAVKVYQNVPTSAHSSSGLYSHCVYQQPDSHLVVVSETSDHAPLAVSKAAKAYSCQMIPGGPYGYIQFSSIIPRGNLPLFLQHKKILV